MCPPREHVPRIAELAWARAGSGAKGRGMGSGRRARMAMRIRYTSTRTPPRGAGGGLSGPARALARLIVSASLGLPLPALLAVPSSRVTRPTRHTSTLLPSLPHATAPCLAKMRIGSIPRSPRAASPGSFTAASFDVDLKSRPAIGPWARGGEHEHEGVLSVSASSSSGSGSHRCNRMRSRCIWDGPRTRILRRRRRLGIIP